MKIMSWVSELQDNSNECEPYRGNTSFSDDYTPSDFFKGLDSKIENYSVL